MGRELRENNRRQCIEPDQDDEKLQIGAKEFGFDRVFSDNSSQEEIFNTCARNLILGCFSGFNATILAYG